MRVLYILPHPEFFFHCNGVAGHIAHANGVLEAFSDICSSVDVVAHTEAPMLAHEGCFIHVVPISGKGIIARQRWSFSLLKQCRILVTEKKYDFCYIRYSVGFVQYLPLLKRILGTVPMVMEVNSFGAQQHTWAKRIEEMLLEMGNRRIIA